MPLDVIIATPSGPFGELIRLTLEADPSFRCTLVDTEEKLKTAFQSSDFQAIIFDCSISENGSGEVPRWMEDIIPSPALLLIPSDSDPDMENLQGIQADGYISRPFDIATLTITVSEAIQKKTNQPLGDNQEMVDDHNESGETSLQKEIEKTSAGSGIILQNGRVVESTAEMTPELQNQARMAVNQNWKLADASDLIRYVKDPDTEKNWMLYATQIETSTILALLYPPQTPVTKVHSETVKIARQLRNVLSLTLPDALPTDMLDEFQEPPNLQDIFSETSLDQSEIETGRFPVEWFKEESLPETDPLLANQSAAKPESTPVPITESEENHFIPAAYDSEIQKIQEFTEYLNKLPEFETPPPKDKPDAFSSPETQNPDLLSEVDLGQFQPVSIISETSPTTEIDSEQPSIPNTDNEHTSSQETSDIWPLSDSIDPQYERPPNPNNVDFDFIQRFALPKEKPEEEGEDMNFAKFLDRLSAPNTTEPNSDNQVNITQDDNPDSGVDELLPDGDTLMQNIDPENDKNEDTSGDTNPIEVPNHAETADANLFSKMNMLESAAESGETETVTAAMIPFDESFLLHRQIASQLSQCMTQLCEAFGWKLENLTIRPTYMQWTVTISSLFSPEEIVGIVRQQTTQCLFKNLPELENKAEENDLWAAENMLATGLDFVPSHHWQNFILRRKNDEIA